MKGRLAPRLKAAVAVAAIVLQFAAFAESAAGFCGFYVAKADSKLFNRSSKVVLARDATTTTITMASDYQGEPKEFAVVIPVPAFIERKQIDVIETKFVDHLDAYTAPRLVEYYDPDPCDFKLIARRFMSSLDDTVISNRAVRYAGVTVEANYDVGEYDVSILSASENDGLVNWLNDNGYKIPPGAETVLGSYIKQKMRFFVARVNLDRMPLTGSVYLRPLRVHYETAKFMLPLRLGTVNADGPQDLIIYALTRNGRVEAANYRTAKLPTDVAVPLFVKENFATFYKAVFDRAVKRGNMATVFVEYAWDMASCDPCAADPLSSKELVELGARWINPPLPTAPRGQTTSAYVTRLHVRYDANTFPEDLALMETSDRGNFQARYVLHHAWQAKASCEAADKYRASLPAGFKQQASNLSGLTGWPLPEIITKMQASGQAMP
jgi:hypothetical protein